MRLWTCSICASGQSRTPAWAASTAPNTNWCSCSNSGPGRHRNNVQLGAYGRNRSNVWPYAAGPGFGRAGEEGRLAALHPTVKPTAMIADAILDVTRRGDIVLDPFLGSGATLMACERTGRRCCGLRTRPALLRRHRSSLASLHRRGGAAGDDRRDL